MTPIVQRTSSIPFLSFPSDQILVHKNEKKRALAAMTTRDRLKLYGVRAAINLVVLAALAGTAAAIYYITAGTGS